MSSLTEYLRSNIDDPEYRITSKKIAQLRRSLQASTPFTLQQQIEQIDLFFSELRPKKIYPFFMGNEKELREIIIWKKTGAQVILEI